MFMDTVDEESFTEIATEWRTCFLSRSHWSFVVFVEDSQTLDMVVTGSVSSEIRLRFKQTDAQDAFRS
jgi:hypothetical protein